MLENIRGSAESDFYRNIWGNEKTFYNLPFISIENFIATPLRERTYKKEKGLAKIVRSGAKPFLVQCGLSDLKKENYGDVLCKRPLVLLSNSHEALEKSLWFYEHDILPLIGEPNNFSLTAFTSEKYNIDAIVSEGNILLQFLEEFKKEYTISRIETVTLIEKKIEMEHVQKLKELFPKVRLVLALPETGAFAEHCQKSDITKNRVFFHEDDNSIVEIVEADIVVTRLTHLVTPVIRYKTNIHGILNTCICGKQGIVI